jgi:hypothetical protein
MKKAFLLPCPSVIGEVLLGGMEDNTAVAGAGVAAALNWNCQGQISKLSRGLPTVITF